MTRDKYGLIIHSDGDGGDTCADTFRFLYAEWLCGRLDIDLAVRAISHLIPLRGIGRRHPDQWDDPCDFSQDQQTPMIAFFEEVGAMLAVGVDVVDCHKLLSDFQVRHQMRNWRYQNLDWAMAMRRNVYKPRNREAWGDFQLFLNSCWLVIDSYMGDNVSKDINHIVMLIQCGRGGHSFWSNLARIFYRFRFKGPQYAFDHFHRADNPEIAVAFYKPISDFVLAKGTPIPKPA